VAASLLLCDRLKERCERRSCAGRRLVLVRRERLTPELGDAHVCARKKERAAGAGDGIRRARLA
jgi:hypothetical protein